MIRNAREEDIDRIDQIYNEILDYEQEHGSHTNWQKGLYPTRETAVQAFKQGTLFVGSDDNELFGCVILNQIQPKEYEKIAWEISANPEDVMVIHTLCIRPSFFGQGKGQEFVAFSEEYARNKGWSVIRLDTYEKNDPAAKLYQKLGYRFAGLTEFHFQNVIWETLQCFEKNL